MDLTVLLEPRLDLPRLSQVLDEMGHAGRVHSMRTWGKKKLAAIYEASDGFRNVGLDDFVPASSSPLVEVVHELHNSLWLFTDSQKRFCKAGDESAASELCGYNEMPASFFTGPGYFAARASDKPGEVVFDYQKRPTARVVGWPEMVPNEGRLGRFVYAGCVDYLRGLSNHVSVGRAQKGGKLLDVWFVLCRKDPG